MSGSIDKALAGLRPRMRSSEQPRATLDWIGALVDLGYVYFAEGRWFLTDAGAERRDRGCALPGDTPTG